MRISDWSSDVCSSDLEGVGLHVDVHVFAITRYRDPLQVTPRERGLAVDGAEGGKILFAHQRLGGAMHDVGVERLAHPGQVLAAERGPHRPVHDAVAIAPGTRREAGAALAGQLGRATCRERVCYAV